MTTAAPDVSATQIDEPTPAWKFPTPSSPAIVPDADGFYHDADWLRIECDWPGLKPRDGFAPLWAEIDASLTFREALAIPLDAGTPMKDIYPHILHRVRAWNVREYNASTGQMEPVPPPSEIGMEALMRVRPLVVEWLALSIKLTSLNGGPNRKNETTPSGDGRDGPSVAG